MDGIGSQQNMNAHVATENGDYQLQSQTVVSQAIHWIQDYVDKNPHTQAAREARSIICGLKALHQRPSLDELLGLIGQIAKSDQGLQEINRAKIRMSQQTTGKSTENDRSVNRIGVKYRV
jgi:hypothetical protein